MYVTPFSSSCLPNTVTAAFNGVPSSCFPASTGLGSSFDTDLAHRVGEALGDDSRAKGTPALLQKI